MFAFERDFKMQRVFAQVFCAVNMQSTDPASVADLNFTALLFFVEENCVLLCNGVTSQVKGHVGSDAGISRSTMDTI